MTPERPDPTPVPGPGLLALQFAKEHIGFASWSFLRSKAGRVVLNSYLRHTDSPRSAALLVAFQGAREGKEVQREFLTFFRPQLIAAQFTEACLLHPFDPSETVDRTLEEAGKQFAHLTFPNEESFLIQLKSFLRRQAWVMASRLATSRLRGQRKSGRTISPGTHEVAIFSRVMASLAVSALQDQEDYLFETDLVEPESPFWARRLRPLLQVLKDSGSFAPTRVLLLSSLNEAVCLGWLRRIQGNRVVIGPTPLSGGPDMLGVPARLLDGGPLGSLSVAKELPDQEFECDGDSMVG